MAEPTIDDPVARVLKVLLNEPFVKSVKAAYQEMLNAVSQNRLAWRSWPFEQIELSPLMRYQLRDACGQGGVIRTLFEKQIIPKLDNPVLVTANDLTDAFAATMQTDMANFEQCYRLFAGRSAQLMEEATLSLQLPFCLHSNSALYDEVKEYEDPNEADENPRLFNTAIEDKLLDEIDDQPAVWSRNGVELKLERDTSQSSTNYFKPVPCIPSHRIQLGLRIDGHIANGALQILANTISDRAMMIAACVHEAPEAVEMAELNISKVLKKREIISELFDCVILQAKKKDPLAARINVALRLLEDAHQQENIAISIALTVTAVESLLGSGKSDISTALAQNVAILMEPKLDRRGNAEAFVKKLYDIRSRVLHGETLDFELDAFRNGRWLALRIIYYIASLRVFFRKYEGQEAVLLHGDLLKQLGDSKYREDFFTSQTETDPVRELWTDGKVLWG